MRMNTVIRKYMDEHGIKQSHVSDRSGIDQKKLWRLLSGNQKMHTDDYELICESLNVSPAFFYVVNS